MIVTTFNNVVRTSLLLTACGSSALWAQSSSIQANIRGYGGNSGKCTIEAEVDGAAEVRVNGNQASIRTLNGTPAVLRRMDCNGVLPANPADFHLEGVDGRGSVNLVRDPRQGGGAAVVHIQDPDQGREGYTFDLLWSNTAGAWSNNNGGYGNGGYNNGGNNNGNGNGNWGGRSGNRRRDDDWDDNRYNNGGGYNNGGYGNNAGYGNNGWSTANAGNAMRACQSEVVNRIRRSGAYSDVQFLRAEFDNNGNFSCRADFNTGRLFDVRLDRR
jgi:hypothetical protein